jgi:hypothetical protein
MAWSPRTAGPSARGSEKRLRLENVEPLAASRQEQVRLSLAFVSVEGMMLAGKFTTVMNCQLSGKSSFDKR